MIRLPESDSRTVFDQVRAACRAVAEQASHVRINESRIEEYGAKLPLAEAVSPQLDAQHHYLGGRADTAAFLITLDAINFGSGYFPHLRKRPGLSGYFTVATCLTEYFRAEGPLSARELQEVGPDDCARLFGQRLDDDPVRELMSLFARALNDLGAYLLSRFDGSFTALIEAAEGSGESLVRILAEMPFFQDVEMYRGMQVPFYKRAQLTAADLALAFEGAGYGWFTDLHRLTIFADNLVPHVLRVDGVLQYDERLGTRIDAGELIPPGSEEEVEIRASAVHAVELLVEALASQGREVTALGLDYLLWNRGQRPDYKAHPRHRTRTVFY